MSHVVSVTRGGRVRRSGGNSNGSSLHGISSKPTWRVWCCSALPTSRSRCGPGDLGGGSDGTSSMRVIRGFTTTVRWPGQKAARRSYRRKRSRSGIQPVCRGARLCKGSNTSDSREPNAVGLLRVRPYIPHSRVSRCGKRLLARRRRAVGGRIRGQRESRYVRSRFSHAVC